jgi:FG-GAP-like repeat
VRAPRTLAALALLGAAALANGAGADPEDAGKAPFAVSTLRVPGRPLEALTAAVAGERTPRLVVVSVEGAAPDERRHVSSFVRSGEGLAPAGTIEVPAEFVAFDVADLEPGGDLEIALLAGERLEVRSLAGGALLRERRFDPPLPLPPRTRGLGRQPIVGAWSGDGALSALVPAYGGLAHVSLDGGPVQLLPFPLVTDYTTADDSIGLRPGVLAALIGWPELGQGDDDGDGRPDLLALSRYEVAVFRTSVTGLPAEPTRRATLRPFTPEEELRSQATSASLFARDLDGDGLVDLVLHRTFGTLLRSDATTRFWRNRGSGADPSAAPDASIAGSGGFGSIFLEDLEGDGRVEAIQLLVPFGVVQLIRALVTQTVQAQLTGYRFEGPGLGSPRPSFEQTLTLALDADDGRVAGVLPTARGDWNGDGLRDLLQGESLERIAIRLGARTERGTAFGSVAVQQDVPSSDRGCVADLDGDGLDDLTLYDTRREGEMHFLRNRGVLPGGPSQVRGAEGAR